MHAHEDFVAEALKNEKLFSVHTTPAIYDIIVEIAVYCEFARLLALGNFGLCSVFEEVPE